MLRLSFFNFLIPPPVEFPKRVKQGTFCYRKEDVGFPLVVVCLDFSTMGGVNKGSIRLPGKGLSVYHPSLPDQCN
jgi:hypothetical protein